jgi:ribosomal protein S18 acetylase RimI-like enzyme
MQFELTEALVNDILFSMEDQNGEFILDTRDGIVIGELDDTYKAAFDDETGRFISLPEWNPSEGYRLMEKFAATFRNSVVRKKLSEALDRGRGVFRAFKDTLAVYPEAEQLWFSFKEREMRRIVLDWYNGLREEWGLLRIGGEPEETVDLVREDFQFRSARESDRESVVMLHHLCLDELAKAANVSLKTDDRKNDAGRSPAGKKQADFIGAWAERLGQNNGGEPVLVAETGAGDFAGYAAAAMKGDTLYITALEVPSEYRGLGIGKALLSKVLESPAAKQAACVAAELPSEAEGFARALFRESFSVFSTVYVLRKH